MCWKRHPDASEDMNMDVILASGHSTAFTTYNVDTEQSIISNFKAIHRTDIDPAGKILQLEWDNTSSYKQSIMYQIEYTRTDGKLYKYLIPHLNTSQNQFTVQLNTHDSFETVSIDYVRDDDDYTTGLFLINNQVTIRPFQFRHTSDAKQNRYMFKPETVINTLPNCDFIYDRLNNFVECMSPARPADDLKQRRRLFLPDKSEHVKSIWNSKYKLIEPAGVTCRVQVANNNYDRSLAIGYDTSNVKQKFGNIPATGTSGTVDISYTFAGITKTVKLTRSYERVTWMNDNLVISDQKYPQDISITSRSTNDEDWRAYYFQTMTNPVANPTQKQIDKAKDNYHMFWLAFRSSLYAKTTLDYLQYDPFRFSVPGDYDSGGVTATQGSPYVQQGNHNGQPFPPDNGSTVWRVSSKYVEFKFSAPVENPVFAIWSLHQPGWTGKVRVISHDKNNQPMAVPLVKIDKGANQRLTIYTGTEEDDMRGFAGNEGYGQFMCKGTYDNISLRANTAEYYWNVMIGSYIKER